MIEKNETADEVMNIKQLSSYLKLSIDTLRHKVMKEKIPFFKIDGAVRFSRKKIDVWLEEKHRGTKKKQVKYENELFTNDEENK